MLRLHRHLEHRFDFSLANHDRCSYAMVTVPLTRMLIIIEYRNHETAHNTLVLCLPRWSWHRTVFRRCEVGLRIGDWIDEWSTFTSVTFVHCNERRRRIRGVYVWLRSCPSTRDCQRHNALCLGENGFYWCRNRFSQSSDDRIHLLMIPWAMGSPKSELSRKTVVFSVSGYVPSIVGVGRIRGGVGCSSCGCCSRWFRTDVYDVLDRIS